MKYPRQIPVPTAWLKALILSTFVFTAAEVEETEASNADAIWFDNWANSNPEEAIFAAILIILSPIAIIAIVHYFLHLILGAISPQLQSEQVQKRPKLTSVWEGVYGWLVICVATLVMIAMWSSTSVTFSSDTSVPIAIKLTWIATAAYLYQLEYSTRQK